MKQRNLKIFILFAFAFTVVILVTFFSVTYYSLNKTLSQSKEEKQVLKVMLYLDNLQTYSTDIESLERPHQISRQPEKYFVKFGMVEENYKKQLTELCKINDIEGLPNNVFLNLKTLCEKRLSFTKQILTLSAAGNLKAVSELLIKEDSFDVPVKNEIKKISDSGRSLLKKFQEEHDSKAQETYKLFGLLSIIAFVVISFLFFRIWENINVVSENKFLQNLIEHLPGIFYMYNRNGEFKMWNKNYEELFGYSSDEIKKMYPADFYENGEGKEFIKNRIENIFNGNNPSQVEVTAFSKQGEKIPLMINGWLIDYNGEVNLIGTGLDLRELKRKQEIIYKEKDFLDKLINNLPGIFVMYNQKGNIYKWNKNVEEIFGYTTEEIKQMNVLDFIPEEDVGAIKNKGSKIANEKILFIREGDLVTKSKEKISFRIRSWSIDYKGETVIVSLGFDISETKKKQLLLNKLNDIIVHANTFAAITDIKTRKTIFINNSFRKALEVGDDEEIKINEFHSEEEHRYFKDVIMPQIFKQGIWNGEYSFWSKSNKKIFVIAEWILHKDEAGNAKEISVTAIDISEQKKSETEIVSLNNELRQLSLHLQDVIEEEKATMAKEIHDEFGQNLVALSMNAAWLKTNLQNKDKKTEELINEQVSISVDAIQKSRLLFNSLRPYMLEEIGLVAAIRWHAKAFLKLSNIKIEIHSNAEEEKLPKEVSLCLYRIFQESLNNVASHSKATKVTIDVYKNDQMIEMVIEDNGIGFDTTNVNIINSHGLLGIRERVYAQRGKYFLNAVLGKGTRMQIQIPLVSTNENS